MDHEKNRTQGQLARGRVTVPSETVDEHQIGPVPQRLFVSRVHFNSDVAFVRLRGSGANPWTLFE